MILQLTQAQILIHNRALSAARSYRNDEWQIVEALQLVDSSKLYKSLELSSSFQYAVRLMELTEPVAYCFLAVARKANKISQLNSALREKQLQVSKASRIVSSLTEENASELIEFAKTHSVKEIDMEVARRNPKAQKEEKVKILSESHVEIKVAPHMKVYQDLKRVQTLASQSGDKEFGLASAIAATVKEYLAKHDPVQKALRAQARKEKAKKNHADPSNSVQTELAGITEPEKQSATTVAKPFTSSRIRIRLKAEEIHTVNARDGGRCTYVDQSGHRCPNERWLDVHHIRQVKDGGSNDPSNLTTLCWFHHDLVHQLSFDFQFQRSEEI